jgi:hypothetical protein
MAANPLVQLGTLNRLIASVSWPSFAYLTITAPFLNREGISITLEGEATRILPAMTGTVNSPEPYQMATVTANLLKTQPLSGLYKAQMESSTLLGNCVVRPDSLVLPAYDFYNMAIESVREQRYSGEDAGWVIVFRGYYIINNSQW